MTLQVAPAGHVTAGRSAALLLEGVTELELGVALLLEGVTELELGVALLLDGLEELLPPVLELEPASELELFESALEVPSSLEELVGSVVALEELTTTSPELEDWSSLVLEVPGV